MQQVTALLCGVQLLLQYHDGHSKVLSLPLGGDDGVVSYEHPTAPSNRTPLHDGINPGHLHLENPHPLAAG